MSLKPTFYTEKEGGKFLSWPFDYDIHDYDMVVGGGDLSFALSAKETIKIHSLHWGPIGDFRAEWDVVNGWRTPSRPPENDVPKQTAAGSILAEAARLVGGDRQRTHGDKLQNHENIARLWNAYLDNISDSARNLAPLRSLDVALMMALVKIARTQLGSHNPDNYVDLAGYAAVAGEIAERTR